MPWPWTGPDILGKVAQEQYLYLSTKVVTATWTAAGIKIRVLQKLAWLGDSDRRTKTATAEQRKGDPRANVAAVS